MEEKIKSAKVAILSRIEKAVSDETKSLSAETLTAMANIVTAFDRDEEAKKMPKYNPMEVFGKFFADKAVISKPETGTSEGI